MKNSAVSDMQIISALLSSNTMAEAAQKVGITPRAIYTRMNHQDFKAAYEAAQRDLLRSTINTLQNALSQSVQVIASIMNDGNASPGIRLQAATTILKNANDLIRDFHNHERGGAYALTINGGLDLLD